MHLYILDIPKKAPKVTFQTMREINNSVYQSFILLANLCKVAGTIFSVFLAGKLRIKPCNKYK